jgi:hypothetical protein
MGRKKSYKIFEMDYLQHADLTEDDLYYLFETPSLNYSFLVDEFKRTNQEITDEKKIINLVKTDKDWMYKYFWTSKQREEFEKDVKEAYINIRQCGKEEAESSTQWWILMYGLTDSKLKNDKNISKLCDD